MIRPRSDTHQGPDLYSSKFTQNPFGPVYHLAPSVSHHFVFHMYSAEPFYTRSLWLPSHFVTVSCLHRAVQSATMSLGLCGLQVNTFKRLDWKVLFSFELWKCSDKTVCNFVEYYTPCGFSMPPHESFVKKKITFASSSIYLKSRGISNTACSAVPRKSILHY